MPRPVVSVVMAVLNGQRYVGATIESVLSQTVDELELVVVDDGSTDRTPAMLRRFARRDGRVHVVRRPSEGIARARNEAVTMSRGKYLAIIDSDDIAEPDRLRKQIDHLEANETICVGSSVRIIDSKGRPLTVLHPPTDDASIQQKVLAGHGAIYNPSATLLRDDFEAVGGYQRLYEPAEDIDLWLRLGERGSLANLPEPLLRYRMHAESISEAKTMVQRRGAYLACQHAWARRGIDGRYDAWHRWRPGNNRQAQRAFFLQYGWWAKQSGESRTAAVYAAKALCCRCAMVSRMSSRRRSPSWAARTTHWNYWWWMMVRRIGRARCLKGWRTRVFGSWMGRRRLSPMR